MPHEHHRRARFFSRANYYVATISNLTDCSRRRGDFIEAQRLDGVDDDKLISTGANSRGDVIRTGTRDEMQLFTRIRTETLCPELDLACRLLAARVKHWRTLAN